MSDSSVIDLQAIENLRALNPGDNDEFLREIVGIFLEDTPQRIAELEQSLAAGDVPKFTRAAHSIKGSSSNLGAMLLRSAASVPGSAWPAGHHARSRMRAQGMRSMRDSTVGASQRASAPPRSGV